MQPRLPIRKSQKDIETFLKNGKIFGEILKKTYIKIREGSLKNPIEIQGFLSNSVNKINSSIWRLINFPFIEQKNYLGDQFNHICCVSVNDTVAHCRPSSQEFNTGDIVSVDFGIALSIPETNRWLHFDSAFSTSWGCESPDWVFAPHKSLINILTEQPQTTYRIAETINETALDNDLNTLVMLTGHGIGYSLHEEPYIRNAPGQYSNVSLFDGLCFCAEPVFVLPKRHREGLAKAYIDSDGWSIKTVDGQPASHFETMFCVIDNKLVDICGITEWFC